MRLPLLTAGLLALSTSLAAAETVTLDSLAGDYGDRNGRLRCAADNEFLRFGADGALQINEGRGLEPAGTVALDPDERVRLTLPDGMAILLTVYAGELTISGAERDGSADADLLQSLQDRHGGFVRCDFID